MKTRFCFFWMLLTAATLASTTPAVEPGDIPPVNLAAPVRRIVVVVNTNNPVTTVELSDLERIFRREKMKWPGGETITVYERPTEQPIRQQFSNTVLRKRPSEMLEYWLNLKLTRGLEAPKVCQSATLLKRYLERVNGGVGYLYEDEVDETMKIVAIIDGN